MMVFSQLDDAMFDTVQTEIGYCKLFPHILKDFVTRLDCKEIMKSTNLPVTTSVTTAVVTTTDTGTGKGQGSGQTTPIYTGSTPSPASKVLEQEKEVIKNAGGSAAAAAIGSAE